MPIIIISKLKPFLLPCLGGLLLAFSFPKFDVEIFAWVALVPLMIAIQGQNPARAAKFGLATGAVFYFIGLSWIINTMTNYGGLSPVVSWLILALLVAWLSMFMGIFCYLLRWKTGSNSWSILLKAPVIWTSLEYIRSTPLELGFSWLGLGYSQVRHLPVIQIAEYTGVYGISALIVFVNAGLFLLIRRDAAGASPIKQFRLRVASVTVIVFGCCLGYGMYAINLHQPDKENVRVGLVQGNIEQHLKWNPLYLDRVLQTYRDLTLKAADSKPDLIVWPEASAPFYFSQDKKETEYVANIIKTVRVPTVVGSPYLKQPGKNPVLFNSAFYVSASGNIKGRYDKIHLVPFGEFVPFQSLLFFVDKMVVGIGNFGRGEKTTLFKLGKDSFAVSICFEITFPDLVRRPVKEGAGFLVNITNDAWFGKSAASYQHMDMAALRAVENRVPIVRSANTGISGMIDATGRIRQTTKLFVKDVLITHIQPRTQKLTYYSRFGDVFSYLCILASLALGALTWRGKL